MISAMNTDALAAFLVVCETGSVAGAARLLGLPRGTIRRRVEALEAELGATLLDRSGRGARPTDAGEVLAREGKAVVDAARAATSAVQRFGDAGPGPIRAVVPFGMPPQAGPLLFQLARSHLPDVRLELSHCEDPRGLTGADADLVVSLAEASLPPPWVSFDVLTVRVWLVASPRYLERRGQPADVEALGEHVLLAWRPPEGDAGRWPLVGGGSVEVEPVLTSADVHLLRSVAAADQGIAFVPDAMLPDASPELDELVPVLPEVVGGVRVARFAAQPAVAEQVDLEVLAELARAVLENA